MRRAYVLVSLGLSLLACLTPGCQKAPDYWEDAKAGQKRVLVTFPPLYAITHAVAGENAYVLSLLSTTGPHDYDGAPTDLLKINKADLFIYNGLTLDDAFADKMRRNQKNRNIVVLNVGEQMEKKYDELLHKEEGHEKDKDHDRKNDKQDKHDHDGHGHDHKHGEHDPHIWLGPKQAQKMADIIAQKLGEIDPTNKSSYEARAKKFKDELQKIEEDGKAAFKDKKNKNIVTMHEAFDYFADAFGVKIVETIQKKPGTDPDAASLARLRRICKDQKVAVIAVEPQYSRVQAEALQRNLNEDGIDVKIVTLDPLETAPIPEGKRNPDPGYYLKSMRENIETLARALP